MGPLIQISKRFADKPRTTQSTSNYEQTLFSVCYFIYVSDLDNILRYALRPQLLQKQQELQLLSFLRRNLEKGGGGYSPIVSYSMLVPNK